MHPGTVLPCKGRKKTMELNQKIADIEATLQDARGELSLFENKFPTDSAQAQLIEELIERLDEASDPDEIRESVLEYADDYGVDCEEVAPFDIKLGDVIFFRSQVAEVVALDSWWKVAEDTALGYDPTSGHDEYELTVEPFGQERDTFVVSANANILRTLDI